MALFEMQPAEIKEMGRSGRDRVFEGKDGGKT
jgi:hypothetical protein